MDTTSSQLLTDISGRYAAFVASIAASQQALIRINYFHGPQNNFRDGGWKGS